MSDRIQKMLEALLKSDNLLYWVGGYVYGETSNSDPYILLYATADNMKEKICRVYPHDFGKLPSFIPTTDVHGDTDGNPSKDAARNKRIYHECPPFEVALFNGKETSLGPEKRFSDVLRLSKKAQAAVNGRATPPPPSNGTADHVTPPPPAPSTDPHPPPDAEMFKPFVMAMEAGTMTRFLANAAQWLTVELSYKNATADNVGKVVGFTVPEWQPAVNGNKAMLACVEKYFSVRADGKEHDTAKAEAIREYNRV